jgi:hypothetical protein
MYYAHLNSRDYVFDKQIADAVPETNGTRVVEVTEDIYNEISVGWRLENGTWVEPYVHKPSPLEIARAKIEALKANLQADDYKFIKQYEASAIGGELPYTVEELQAISQQRDEWRAEINALEEEIKNILHPQVNQPEVPTLGIDTGGELIGHPPEEDPIVDPIPGEPIGQPDPPDSDNP